MKLHQSKPEGKTARLVRQWTGLWQSIVGYARHPLLEDQVLSGDSLFSQVLSSAALVGLSSNTNIAFARAFFADSQSSVLLITSF